MSLETRLKDLEKDLLKPSGPDISTNRNYPFAIFHYHPEEEFKVRELVGSLAGTLRIKGWNVRNVDLLDLLLRFLKEQEEGELLDAWIDEEKTLYRKNRNDFLKPLNFLKDSLSLYFNDKNAYPARVLEEIRKTASNADGAGSVIFLSRIGALYPFYRTSALLRYLDEGVKIPTVILYPGVRVEQSYLSFMGEMNADRDYRPRIY